VQLNRPITMCIAQFNQNSNNKDYTRYIYLV